MSNHVSLPPEKVAEMKAERTWRPSKIPQFRMSKRRVLLMQGDIAATLISVFLGLWVWAFKAKEAFTLDYIFQHAFWFAVLPLLWFILAQANDYYSLRVTSHFSSSLIRLIGVNLQLLLIYLATFFLSPPNSLPRLFILYYAGFSLVLIGIWRGFRLLMLSWSGSRRRALFVGTGKASEVMWRVIKREAQHDYEIIGCVTSGDDTTPPIEELTVLGTGTELSSIVESYGVTELIVTYINDVPDDVFQGLMVCYGQGIEITPMPMLYEEITGRIPIQLVGEHLWALVLPIGGRSWMLNLYLVLKRLIDIVFSLIGLVFFAPLFPVIALLMKLDSPGPVFYRQKRVGQGDKEFTVLKLRSMIATAEKEGGARWASENDPRITRLGKFLRKTRLDEVPQLVNVLCGQMSLVGPRPERPEFVNMLASEISFYRTRLAVKPGLTGWAQVRFRYGSSTQDALIKLQYDLYYIRHQSLILDLIIMVKTIGTMLRFQGT